VVVIPPDVSIITVGGPAAPEKARFPMPATHTIGIDLGGTNIKAGVVDADGRPLVRRSIPTQSEGGPEHVIARLAQLTQDLIHAARLARSDVQAVGLGAPGPMSHKLGIIYACPNLPGWKDVPLRARLHDASGLPVALENDANAAAFGEFVAGAGRGTRDLVLLTLGTGIGGGVIMDGRLQRGAFDNAGEVGHMIVVPDGRPCPCGQRGCLERYSSANAVAERLIEAVQAGEDSILRTNVGAGAHVTSSDVAQAARNGDALATRVWDEMCRYLAVGCVNLQHLLNPERIVLGGGLIGAGPQLFDAVRAHFERLTWRIARDQPTILPATLGDDGGVIGAAALARIECVQQAAKRA